MNNIRPHTLLLAEPRGFCAGVVRAIEVINYLLENEEPPIYSFHEIVHNKFIVDSFKKRGIIFVDSIDEVPEHSRIVFSAHGISPTVMQEAEEKSLKIIDATCPLVTKVHLETKKAAKDGFDILLVGHRGHDEVEGTLGEAPSKTTVIDSVDEVNEITINSEKVFVVTQTTLSVNDTNEIIDSISEKFPKAEIRNDICYATTNRQSAVQELAKKADIILVVGSPNSSNSVRLMEHAKSSGAVAYRIEGIDEIKEVWYKNVGTVGLTAGASVPDELLEPIINDLIARGVTKIDTISVAQETIEFKPPNNLPIPKRILTQ
ncbi:MAG: 4-hydroxy-3-methylbut-2-enyl diphosphate reductase [Dehalococcoidia bacterium]|jgi:4-hydroxy-3-methylbut-2-enyl diphosphate reductase|nr:MAG: 4-hydroxy-3-methylbut-2-enyl diphosphate reductase [Chloroflexota bacterium]|tara:strand:- start:3220 stop:4173 length:954 start_codon:yes stop_codon:yes gene_type:complete